MDTDINAKEATKTIANTLFNYRTLDNFKLNKTDSEVGFVVIDSGIDHLSFDNEMKQFFLNIEVPLSVSLIRFIVRIKTFREV